MGSYCLRCDKIITEKPHYGQHLHCFEGIFRVSGHIEFQSLVRKEATSDRTPVTHAHPPHLTSYFGGNYKKYDAVLGESHYILKLSKPEYPELAPVEFICNKIAHICGLRVPTPFTLIDFGKGELAFVSRNFMDHPTTHSTLTHIYHYLTPGADNYTVEEISKTIFRETHSVEDVEQFLKMLIFDAMIGNHDRHGRNIAVVETPKGKRLTPIYDNPSYLGLEAGSMLEASFAPKSKIWTASSREPGMRECLDELARLNMLPLISDFYTTVDIQKIQAFITNSHSLSEYMKKALGTLIQKRYQELSDYVTHIQN